MPRRICLAVLVALLPAGAQALTPISQLREVSLAIERETRVCPINFNFPPCPSGPPSQITIENFSDAEAAPDLSDWSATASVPGFASQASLVSTTSASALVAEGSRTGVAPFGGSINWEDGTLTDILEEHVTGSRYEMSFELTEVTSYSLEGTLELYTVFSPFDDASLSLIGPGGQVVASLDLDALRDCDLGELECSLNGSVSESGVLQPGIYTLAAATNGRADKIYRYGDSDSGSFAVSLELLPPAAVPLLPPAVLPLLGALLALATRVRA